MEVIERFEVLSFFNTLFNDLALLSLSFKLFWCLNVLLFFVYLTTLENVLHEFTIFGLFFNEYSPILLNRLSEKLDVRR